MATQQLSTNTFGEAKWVVSPTASDGTHTTIAAALSSATSGDTIFIRPGTYTENPTLKSGVNLTAYNCDSTTPNVVILGKCTFTNSGTVSLSGIQLQTNGDYCLAVTGSGASIVYLNNCFINVNNNTAINFTSSSASSAIYLYNTNGSIATTGIGAFVFSGAGLFRWANCYFDNPGGSTTASTCSGSGACRFHWSYIHFVISTSSNGTMNAYYTTFDVANTTPININGTGSGSSGNFCGYYGGTASAISIGASASLTLDFSDVSSSNTNAITGSGTLQAGAVTFTGSSSVDNVTTQTPSSMQIGNVNTNYGVVCGGTSSNAPLQSIASIGSSGQVLTSNGASALPTFQAVPGGTSSGTPVGSARASSTTATSTSTTLNVISDTPTTSNTVSLITATYTPTNTANTLIFDFSCPFESSAGYGVGFYLFAGSTLLSSFPFAPQGTSTSLICNGAFRYYGTAGTTSSTTYAVYYSALGGTASILQSTSSGAFFNGKVKMQFIVTEVVT